MEQRLPQSINDDVHDATGDIKYFAVAKRKVGAPGLSYRTSFEIGLAGTFWWFRTHASH